MGIYYYNGCEENYLVGNFVENALCGLTLQYCVNVLEKMTIMDKNKIKKTLNVEEIENAKISDDYIKLTNFIEKVNK